MHKTVQKQNKRLIKTLITGDELGSTIMASSRSTSGTRRVTHIKYPVNPPQKFCPDSSFM